MKKRIAILVILMMTLQVVAPGLSVVANQAMAGSTKEVSIMFTGDMHSHLEESGGKGGSPKIMTVAEEIREKYPQSFFVDGGDFSMGTPFQSVYKTDALELKMMARLGVDATTLGNHEFDYGAAGLAEMLNTAKSLDREDERMPAVVSSNIDFDKSLKDKSLKKNAKKLKKAFDNYGVDDYTIVEKEGVKIAVLGVLGEEAISQAPNSGVIWKNYIERTKEIVSEITRNNEADFIVALSHSGLNLEDKDESEDEILAKEVPELDLIVSAHSHTELKKPITVGNTIIVASGEYTDNLGHIVIKKSGDKNAVKSYTLKKLDKRVANHPGISSQVASNKSTVNSKFFGQYGYGYDQVIAKSNYSFGKIENFGHEQGEEPLANLITDAYLKAASKADGDDTPFDVAVTAAGTVRASINKGDITAAEAFNISSIGTGKDGKAGYPLVGVYLTGKELKSIAEIDASISPMMPAARLYTSGLGYSINKHRLILNRAFDINLLNKKGEKTKIENDKLYRVTCSLYAGQMLSTVTDLSHGLISIVPKNKNGKEVKNINNLILKDNGREIKEWKAIADYINDFDNNKVPAKYKAADGRKVVDNSFNPLKIFCDPNNIALMVIALLMIPVVIIAAIIIFLVKRNHSRRGYSKSMFKNSGRGRRRRGGYKRSIGFSKNGAFSMKKGFRASSNNKRPRVKARKFSMHKRFR